MRRSRRLFCDGKTIHTVDSAHTQLLIDENIVHAGRVL